MVRAIGPRGEPYDSHARALSKDLEDKNMEQVNYVLGLLRRTYILADHLEKLGEKMQRDEVKAEKRAKAVKALIAELRVVINRARKDPKKIQDQKQKWLRLFVDITPEIKEFREIFVDTSEFKEMENLEEKELFTLHKYLNGLYAVSHKYTNEINKMLGIIMQDLEEQNFASWSLKRKENHFKSTSKRFEKLIKEEEQNVKDFEAKLNEVFKLWDRIREKIPEMIVGLNNTKIALRSARINFAVFANSFRTFANNFDYCNNQIKLMHNALEDVIKETEKIQNKLGKGVRLEKIGSRYLTAITEKAAELRAA